MRHTILILTVLFLLTNASAADLIGTVVGTDGQPVVGATVLVQTASPKKGAATQRSDEYPDCQKSAVAAADGAFKIAGVDDSLKFQLLVIADGCRPRLLKKVDPAGGPITAKLTAIPTDLDAGMTLKGHVVDSSGAPIAAAKIEPFGCKDGTNRWWGGVDNVCETETYTNAKGEFLLIAKKPDLQFDLKVSARHNAPLLCPLEATGDQDHEIGLTPGATVIGRLLKDEKPLPGITVRMTQQDRGCEKYVGEFSAVTDADGKFTFVNLHPNDMYNLYGEMKSLGDKGALALKPCTVTADGTTVDAGEVTVEPACTVSGQIICSDGKPLPEDTKVCFSRWEAGDSQDKKVGSDGKFEFKGVPQEACEIYVNATGYHVSTENASFETLNGMFLLGLVDGDITDLRVQIDPGPRPPTNQNGTSQQALMKTRLSGVASDSK